MRNKYNKKKILLTGGRGPAVLDLARQLNHAGHTVFMAESQKIYFSRFSNAISFHYQVPHPSQDELAFVQALVDICKTNQIDYLVPGYDEGFIISKFKHLFPDSVQVFVDKIETIDRLNNKYKFIELLKDLHINSPHSVLIHNEEELHAVLGSGEFERPCIVKSVYSAGGLLARTIRENTDLASLDLRYPCIAQTMVQGRVWSTFSVAHQGKMNFFMSYYPLYVFRENGAAICFETQYHQGVFNIVKKIIEATQYTGLIGFDIIEDAQGQLWPIECNPRITSGAHLSRTVHDFASCILEPSTSLRTVPEFVQVQLSRFSMLKILNKGLSSDFKIWLKYFLKSKDVLFDLHDLKPMLFMPLVGLVFVHQYLKYKKLTEENIFLNKDWNEY